MSKRHASSVTIRRSKKGTVITATGSAAQSLFDAISRDVIRPKTENAKPAKEPTP